MLHSKILNAGGVLVPVFISPVLALLPPITLGTVFTIEHSSGSLLASSGMVAFLLLARLKGDDIRTAVIGSVLFLGALGAFFLRGGILYGLSTSVNPGITGPTIGLMMIFYLALAFSYLCVVFVERQPQAPKTMRIDEWAEENRPE